jgi:hypothetical protein
MEWSVQTHDQEDKRTPYWYFPDDKGPAEPWRRWILWLCMIILALSVPLAALIAFLSALPLLRP